MAEIRDTLRLDIDQALRQVRELENALNRALSQITVDIDLGPEVNRLDRELRDAEDSAEKLEREMRDVVKATDRAADQAARLDRETKQASVSASRLGAGLGRLAIGAAAGLGFAAIGRGATSALSAVSDLEESINAVQVQFGEGADILLRFGEDAATSVGLATSEFNQLSVVTGALFSGFIEDEKRAADETIRFTQRATDLASVFNVSVKEALEAMQASLRGEQEPIRRFGVLMDEAAVTAKALALGLAETSKEITSQDKSAARLAIIFEQTNKVAGDFANTQDSLANKMKVAAAEFETAKVALGEALLPVAVKAIDTFQDLVPVLVEVIEATERFGLTVGAIFGSDSARDQLRFNEAVEQSARAIEGGADEALTLANAIASLSDNNILAADTVGGVVKALGLEAEANARALAANLARSRALPAAADQTLILERALLRQIKALDLTEDEIDALILKYDLLTVAFLDSDAALAVLSEDGFADLSFRIIQAADDVDTITTALDRAGFASDTANEAFRNTGFEMEAIIEPTQTAAGALASAIDGLDGVAESLVGVVDGLEGAADPIKQAGEDIELTADKFVKNLGEQVQQLEEFEGRLVLLFAAGFENLARSLEQKGPELSRVAGEFLADPLQAQRAEDLLAGKGTEVGDEYAAQIAEALQQFDFDDPAAAAVLAFAQSLTLPNNVALIRGSFEALLRSAFSGAAIPQFGPPQLSLPTFSGDTGPIPEGSSGGGVVFNINNPVADDLAGNVAQATNIASTIPGLLSRVR